MKCGALGHCSAGGDNRDKLSLILVIKIYACSNSNFEGVEGSVVQTIVEEEGATGVRDGLTKPKVQPILSGAICFVLLHDGSFGFVQHVHGRS